MATMRGFCLPVAPLLHSNRIAAIQMSPDGRCVLTASLDHSARLWSTDDGQFLGELKHDGFLTSIAWSPDGTHVLTAAADATARLWRVDLSPATSSGAGSNGWIASIGLVAVLHHDDTVSSAEFSPRGDRIVTGSKDKAARLWDANTGKAIG